MCETLKYGDYHHLSCSVNTRMHTGNIAHKGLTYMVDWIFKDSSVGEPLWETRPVPVLFVAGQRK